MYKEKTNVYQIFFGILVAIPIFWILITGLTNAMALQ